jgi:hypothetical protein
VTQRRALGAIARVLASTLVALSAVEPAAGQSLELTIDASPALADAAARLEAIDASSLSSALSRAGLQLPRHIRVFLVDDDDPRARGVPRWVAARAFGADTIIILPRRARGYPYDSFESIVLHEIVHLALNVRARGRPLPRWFHEGTAVSVESGWGLGSHGRLLLAAARDPGIDDVTALFASDGEPESATAYLLSAALVEDVRRRHGLAVPGAIAERVGAGESFEQAFRAATGESVDVAAAQAWRVYRGLRWLPILTSATALWAGILVLAGLAFVVRLHRRRRKRWEEDNDDDPSYEEKLGVQQDDD